MKLQVTEAEARLLEYYNIRNFQQLKEVVSVIDNPLLMSLYTKSIGALQLMHGPT